MTAVIKSGRQIGRSMRLAPIQLADHLAEARASVAKAYAKAQAALEAASQEAVRIREEAKVEGFQKGYAEGRQHGEAEGREQAFQEAMQRFEQSHLDVVADMRRVISDFEAMKTDLRIRAERDLLGFAAELVSRLTFQIGRLHREAACENFRRALEYVAKGTDLTVRANPADVEALQTFAATAVQEIDKAAAVHLVSDSDVAPGGCVVRAGCTTVDATLETQVRGLASLLLGGEGEEVRNAKTEDRKNQSVVSGFADRPSDEDRYVHGGPL